MTIWISPYEWDPRFRDWEPEHHLHSFYFKKGTRVPPPTIRARDHYWKDAER